jgi:cell division protein FtsI (penicillin-binding protein 3)
MSEPVEAIAEKRVAWIARLAFFWAFAIVLRLIYLQVFAHEDHIERASRQHDRTFKMPAHRGEILDRTGHPLAVSIRTVTAVVNPQVVKNVDFFASIVGPVLHLDPAALAAELRIHKELERSTILRSRVYYQLKRHISPEEVDSMLYLKRHTFGFLELHRDSLREYPNGPNGAHVVGSIDWSGDGNSGIEQKLNAELRGASGDLQALTDARGGKYFGFFSKPPVEGVDLTLTIHSVIQHEAEKFLEAGVRDSSAEYGSVVVMNPRNGEILALANYPNFDPREEIPRTGAGKQRALERRRNWAVLAPIEPGSVMKMITVAMGIDTGRFTPETEMNCESGRFPRPGRRAIHDLGRNGVMPLSMALVKSSNICAAKVAIALGPDHLWDYLERFGLGHLTGLEAPSESRGIFKPRYCLDEDGKPSRVIDQRKCWGPASHEYIAFGHEIGATATQLARATAVVANGGYRVRPHLVLSKSRAKRGGGSEPVPVLFEQPERVIKPETAHIMRRLMQRVVEEGTGRRAQLDGYSAGGKTGSAEIYVNGVKRSDLNNASFVGFAPVDNPAVVVVVSLGRTPRQGGAAAAPIFKNVTQAALRILQVPADRPGDAPAPARSSEPLPDIDLDDEPEPEPPPANLIAEADAPRPFSPLLRAPRVPDFQGKSVIAVLHEAARAGLDVEVLGRGRARTQTPAPGELLPPGRRILVEFRP